MKLHHRLLPLWILLLGSLWSSPVPAQDPRLEKYLAEVLTITSKYPNQAIPLHRAGGKEKRDAVRLYAIADALTRLAPKKYPRNLSPRERLSILVKEQSPTLSQSFASAEQNALKDIGTATENEDPKAEERRERLDHSDDWQPTREDEKKFLKYQSIDLLKVLPLIAIQGIPSPIPITPLLIILGKKYGFNVLPDSHEKIKKDK